MQKGEPSGSPSFIPSTTPARANVNAVLVACFSDESPPPCGRRATESGEQRIGLQVPRLGLWIGTSDTSDPRLSPLFPSHPPPEVPPPLTPPRALWARPCSES